MLELPPHHLVDYPHITLYDLYYLGRDILLNIVRNRDAVVAVAAEFYSSVNGLQEGFCVDAGDDEVSFVDSFRTFGASADADSREWVTDTGKE